MKIDDSGSILLIFGKGGHTAQMNRFLNSLPEEFKSKKYIALTNTEKLNNLISDSFYCIEARDKYSSFKNIFYMFAYSLVACWQTLRIILKHKPDAVISTGPGMAVVPSIIFKLLGKRVVFFEDWCRFSTSSIAGRVMYHIADLFFVQHKEQLAYFPKAVFKGRL
ncbi:hypothetical protein DXX93_05700 [Thalassotalea euphylliae]|uniref:Polysaccharide biosynthesis protein n=1 Tax=Thalassotalea euphylliae TaxID=1655234 RepID=A0A3E0TP94_9GAMM|nr:PssD/Cps14F family polysaccharide biosynthesis glycosyltransferase [Thalassotalea euphylliae]REL26120.1 hypothetical protein DXX93_05700 [Thalassotalea euphylliae]